MTKAKKVKPSSPAAVEPPAAAEKDTAAGVEKQPAVPEVEKSSASVVESSAAVEGLGPKTSPGSGKHFFLTFSILSSVHILVLTRLLPPFI